jgi:hypothetical protein
MHERFVNLLREFLGNRRYSSLNSTPPRSRYIRRGVESIAEIKHIGIKGNVHAGVQLVTSRLEIIGKKLGYICYITTSAVESPPRNSGAKKRATPALFEASHTRPPGAGEF